MLALAASVVTLITMWLVGNKDVRGFYLGLANQALWLAFIYQTEQWGFLILTVANTYINVRNIILWSNDRRTRPLR